MLPALLVIFAWVPFSLVLFAMLRPRLAVLVCYVGAWLFLPWRAGLVIPMLPDVNRITVASFGVALGVVIFDSTRLFSFRFRWFDVPMLVFCTSPFMSSMANGLGVWDGMSVVLDQLAFFGIPYVMGRVYFSDWEGFRELAIGIFVGGIIYVPLCLFEIRFSPQLHNLFYGYHQHDFSQTVRMGGYRPMVFMQHGLAVGFWMTAASLVGVWLLVSGSLRKIWGVPMIILVPVLFATTVLCKSTAGIGFLFAGVAALFAVKVTRTALPVYLLVAFAPLYMLLRVSGVATGEAAVDWSKSMFGEERAQSLETRVTAENVLTAHALKHFWFGYGKWDPQNPGKPPWMVYNDETGRRSVIPDGMWVLTMGTSGVVGLTSLTAAILLPAVVLRKRVPPQWWAHPMAAPAAACAVLLTLHMADNLLNAMVNPVFIAAIGGLSALGSRVGAPRPQPARAQQMPARRPVVMTPQNVAMPRPGSRVFNS